MDLISVIVPVYKVEAFLNRCVESIIGQTYSKLEIILVDDGSPDECPVMCDEWAERDNRINVIHKRNGGLSDARNAGMEVATGEFIAFVDSDDWIHPQYIEMLYSAIRDYNAEIAACDVRFIYEGSNIQYEQIEPVTNVHSSEEALEMLIKGVGFRAVAWNKLYHRRVLQGEQFAVGRYHEDEFFSYRILAKAEQLVFVNAELYYYFQRTGSIMNSVSSKHLDALDAYLERLDFLKIKYPRLYHSDKAWFCISCLNFYQDALQYESEERESCLKRIKNCRNQVHFSLRELRSYSKRDAVYIIGSRMNMGLISRILILRRKKESENIDL